MQYGLQMQLAIIAQLDSNLAQCHDRVLAIALIHFPWDETNEYPMRFNG